MAKWHIIHTLNTIAYSNCMKQHQCMEQYKHIQWCMRVYIWSYGSHVHRECHFLSIALNGETQNTRGSQFIMRLLRDA